MWLPKPFPPLNIYWTVCFTEKEFKKVCEYLQVKKKERPKFLDEGMGGCMHSFTMGNNVSLVLCIAYHANKNEVRAMIVHEIIHCYQEIVEYMSERHPGKEFMAYIVQSMTADALNKYDKFLEGSK